MHFEQFTHNVELDIQEHMKPVKRKNIKQEHLVDLVKKKTAFTVKTTSQASLKVPVFHC